VASNVLAFFRVSVKDLAIRRKFDGRRIIRARLFNQ